MLTYAFAFYLNVQLLDLCAFFSNQDNVYVAPDGAVHFISNGMHFFI